MANTLNTGPLRDKKLAVFFESLEKLKGTLKQTKALGRVKSVLIVETEGGAVAPFLTTDNANAAIAELRGIEEQLKWFGNIDKIIALFQLAKKESVDFRAAATG